jgi:hypothetical protein
MRYYAQFYHWGLDGKLHTACGTDQVCILDGRKSLSQMVADAFAYAKQLKSVRRFDGFTIVRGELRAGSKSTTLHSVMPSLQGETVFTVYLQD